MRIPDWEVDGTMEKVQCDALRQALEAHRYSVGRAAAQLRIGRSTVYRLMKRYGLSAPNGLAHAADQESAVERPSGGRRRRSESEIVFDGTNYMLVKREL